MEYHVVEDAADLPFFILFQKKPYANSKALKETVLHGASI